MAVINLKLISKILQKSPKARSVFKFTIRLMLSIMEQQKLIDSRKMQQIKINLEKGTIDLGDAFIANALGKAIGEYGIETLKNKNGIGRAARPTWVSNKNS